MFLDHLADEICKNGLVFGDVYVYGIPGLYKGFYAGDFRTFQDFFEVKIEFELIELE